MYICINFSFFFWCGTNTFVIFTFSQLSILFMHSSSYSSGAAAASIRQRLVLIPHSHPDQRYLTERNTDKDTFLFFLFKKTEGEPHKKGGGVDATQGKGRSGQKAAAVTLDTSKLTDKRKLWVIHSVVIVRQSKTERMTVQQQVISDIVSITEMSWTQQWMWTQFVQMFPGTCFSRLTGGNVRNLRHSAGRHLK